MKLDSDVVDLLDSLDHGVVQIKEKILRAHALHRKTLIDSSVQVTKVMSMWVRLQKQSY